MNDCAMATNIKAKIGKVWSTLGFHGEYQAVMNIEYWQDAEDYVLGGVNGLERHRPFQNPLCIDICGGMHKGSNVLVSANDMEDLLTRCDKIREKLC